MYFKFRNIIAIALMLTIPAIFGTSADEKSTTPENQEPTQMSPPDVVYVGTPYDLVSTMLQMAKVKKSDLIYDLGCGDGRILVLAAQKYGTRGVGIDIDPERVVESRQNAAKNNVEDLVKIIQADIFTVDIHDVDVLPMYLHPDMTKRLVPQLEKMKPGSRIVCHEYGLEGFTPDETKTVISNEDNAEHHLMLYTIPLKK
ncbi:MAG: methyltransferase domain-containing protein [Acidobacteriota bacterium]|jgi:SAM-dependent methyltransferase|nr:methyltransferase domain-containing protein [Acidobacteriota bacterium]